MADLRIDLGGLPMATPVTTASGTFGYGTEYAGLLDYAKLGAVTVKGVRRDPWPGNGMPRHCEVPGGRVNAIGLRRANWSAEAVLWARSRGLLDGIPGTFVADTNCPRSDVVYYLWKNYN